MDEKRKTFARPAGPGPRKVRRVTEVEERQMAQAAEETPQWITVALVALAIVVVGVLVGGQLYQNGKPTDYGQSIPAAPLVDLAGRGSGVTVEANLPDRYYRDYRQAVRDDAARAAQEMVSGRLKAPASAVFTVTKFEGRGPFTVQGSVDSQNSFGAMLRSEFRVRLALDGKQWMSEEIRIEEGGDGLLRESAGRS